MDENEKREKKQAQQAVRRWVEDNYPEEDLYVQRKIAEACFSLAEHYHRKIIPEEIKRLEDYLFVRSKN